MKVGDWVLVTPDDFDLHRRGGDLPTQPWVGRVTEVDVDGWIRVKPLFYASQEQEYTFYPEQCLLITPGDEDDSQSPKQS